MSPAKIVHSFHPHETARAESLAGVELARFGRRFVAYFIDLFLVFATYGPAISLLMAALPEKTDYDRDLAPHVHFHTGLSRAQIPHIAWTLWLVLYFGLIMWRWNGRTPGKWLMGIRVVSLTHRRMGLWQSIERALGYGASMLEGGFGFFQYFMNANRLCTHDRIAETIVVRAPRKPKKPFPPNFRSRRPHPAQPHPVGNNPTRSHPAQFQ